MNQHVIKRTVLCLLFLAVVSPAWAQDSNQDPHAGDWYKEQVKNKIDPTTGQPLPQTTTTTATGEGQPVSQSQQAANNSIKKSLGSIDETYRGKHKYYADDFMGNWFDGIMHGDPTSLGVLAGILAIAGGVWFKFGRKKAAPSTQEKASS